MNNKKFCFITCVNNEEFYSECLYYINNLNIPEGYEVEILSIKNAESIASGYNEAMRSSDAKYKIYLHQDAFLINKNMLFEIIDIFSNENIGMIGVCGSEVIGTDGLWWNTLQKHKVGKIYEYREDGINNIELSEVEGKYKKVQAVDGVLMITQYDIPWREDIIDGWHFYDLSQCMEFMKKSYSVVVPNQIKRWCLHDCGLVSINDFDEYRNIFLKEYGKELFPLVSILIPTYNRPKYFKLALESAINQTYPNIEIIVGDDSTNNDTEKLMIDYMNKYDNITYYHNEENIGQYDNDIKLLNMCNGRYVNFLMDDDLFALNKIEKMMHYFINYSDEEISLISSNRVQINEYGEEKESFISDEYSEYLCDKIWDGTNIAANMLINNFNFLGEPTTVLFDKEKLGCNFGEYNNRKFICNVDQAAWYSLLKNGKCILLKENLSYFRRHDNQQLASQEMRIGGAKDYSYMILNAKEFGIINDDISYLKGLKLCIEYINAIMDLVDEKRELVKILNELNNKYLEVNNRVPLVSILIPTYNRVEYFEVALNSALVQTYPKIEIIIGDNSDNKDTAKLMQKYLYKFENITYINNGGNIGLVGNINNILSKASGEYINILMDDDFIKNTKIERMMKYFLKNKDVQLVTSYRKLIDENGYLLGDKIFNAPICDKDTIFTGKEIGKKLMNDRINFIGEPSTVLIKSSMIGEKGKREYGLYKGHTYFTNSDVAMWLNCCMNGKVVYIPEELSYFRQHSGQDQKMTKTQIIGFMEWYYLIEQSYRDKVFIENEEEYIRILYDWKLRAEGFINYNLSNNYQRVIEEAKELINTIEKINKIMEEYK